MKIIRKVLAILMILAIIISSGMLQIVDAVTFPREGQKGSLQLTKYEVIDGKTEDKKPLKDVTFTIYRVEDTHVDPESIPEKYNTPQENGNGYYKMSQTTKEDGIVKFEDLDLGRYLVVEEKAPENVVQKISNFLIDIPMTNPEGNDFVYDVKLEPKNDVVYGGITLTKYGNDDELLEGVEFRLQKKQTEEEETWVDYPDASNCTRKTSNDESKKGKIEITGLPEGEYRLIETDLGEANDGYILDNEKAHTFKVSRVDGKTKVEPEKLDVHNEKPVITKEITSITKNTSRENTVQNGLNSADIGDTIKYKVTVTIPEVIDKLETYNLEDVMDNDDLEIKSNTFKMQGIPRVEGEAVELSESTNYELQNENGKLTVTLVNDSLKNYKSIEITYDAELKAGSKTKEGYTNTVTLTYSNIVETSYLGVQNAKDTTTSTVEDSATIKTGGIKISKKAKSDSGDPLGGAEFKIADSEANAKAGKFIKDENGEDITLKTVEGTGLAECYGLTFGTYYLVETQAPQDEETGKYYNLLNAPKEITISEESYDNEPTVIVNKLGFELPGTGGIGTLIFTLGGIILITIGIIFYKKNSKEEQQR